MKIKKSITLDVAGCQNRVDSYMQTCLNALYAPVRLREAMGYSVLGGGKRLRPLLVYAAGNGFGADLAQLDPAAAAVEFMHGYSLVHDDLPAMDDDDLRRGKPTCHRAFDEATAILAGDALQALAFTVLSSHEHSWPAEIRLEAVKTLAEAVGAMGMVGGQMMDIEAENKKISLIELEELHHLKTGALIRASVRLGALASGCMDPVLLEQLDKFGRLIGLAFQVQDDLLDVESSTEVLGKKAGADEALHKSTYPSIIGLPQAKKRLQELYEQAEMILKTLTIETSALYQVMNLLRERQS
jgi:geranylgeranyl pyrophosphate synthase